MEEIERMIKQSNRSHTIKCLSNQEINVEETSTAYLKQRNVHLLQVYEKSEEIVQNMDMRIFLRPKEKSAEK